MSRAQTEEACASITESTGLPAVDVLLEGPGRLVEAVRPLLARVRM